MKARIQFDMYGDGRLTDLFHDEMSVANSISRIKVKYPAYADGTGAPMTQYEVGNPFSFNGRTDYFTYDFDVDASIKDPMLYVLPNNPLEAAAVFIPLGCTRWRLAITAQVFVVTVNLSQPYSTNGLYQFTHKEFYIYIGGYRG